MAQPLTAANFPQDPLPPSGGQVIAHIGVGGFHRSHQAFVLNSLISKDSCPWTILGVGLMPWDKRMRDVLKSQDNLYSVNLRSASTDDLTIVKSISSFCFVPDDGITSELLSARIIALTVTEKGYYATASGDLDTSNSLIAEDIAAFSATFTPKTAHGLICLIANHHMTAGTTPPTITSCDNLPLNGETTRGVILAFAKAVSPSLADYISTNMKFPNSMVDRITPATTEAATKHVLDAHNVIDAWPVVAEPFLQWVIEDKFTNGRPNWDAYPGVIFTEDVEPYEFMKLRLLNSSHSALSYLSLLLGHEYVHLAMADVTVADFVRKCAL